MLQISMQDIHRLSTKHTLRVISAEMICGRKNASDGKTYEESIKETLLDDLKNMALLEKHMKDYDVKLTKADKKAIDDAAEEFDKANSQKKKRQGIWFRRECKTCHDIDGDRAEDAFGNRSGSKCECNR